MWDLREQLGTIRFLAQFSSSVTMSSPDDAQHEAIRQRNGQEDAAE
jgi:hypothetical protein